MSDWRIGRKGTACTVCGRLFPTGESFVSAIYETESPAEEEGFAFHRVDACPACFPEAGPEPFSRWTTRIPPKPEKKPLLDLGLAKEFLLRLVREDDPDHAKIRFVLALLLLRKRKLKLLGERVGESGKRMEFQVPGEDPGAVIPVAVVELADEDAAGITAELDRLFGLGGEEESGPAAPESA